MTIFNTRLIRIGTLALLGMSVFACGPQAGDTVVDAPFSPLRRPTPPRPGPTS